MKNALVRLVALALTLATGAASAENTTKADGYTIHHNALTTDFLDPQVAHNYRIPRSRNRGMINISVIKDEPGTTGTPVTADVRVYATNYLGQQHPIALREIREEKAVYYIGDFLVHHGETLKFTIQVRPAGETQTYGAEMEQEFFTHY